MLKIELERIEFVGFQAPPELSPHHQLKWKWKVIKKPHNPHHEQDQHWRRERAVTSVLPPAQCGLHQGATWHLHQYNDIQKHRDKKISTNTNTQPPAQCGLKNRYIAFDTNANPQRWKNTATDRYEYKIAPGCHLTNTQTQKEMKIQKIRSRVIYAMVPLCIATSKSTNNQSHPAIF